MPADQLLEIDRYALSRAAQFQAEVLAHFEVYEFHPVVAKLQLYCSEDLGAFYLDVLKDRLYTTAPKSLARRSAQTALHQITHAMLRWMAPFLSFTAEEAWKIFGDSETIFQETYSQLAAPDEDLLKKWERIRIVRDRVNKSIEELRAAGEIGSSLQTEITIVASDAGTFDELQKLGDELKFILLVSQVSLRKGAHEVMEGDSSVESVKKSEASKCERCWHYRTDVGTDAAHPTLCGRCTSNLFGAGETRTVA